MRFISKQKKNKANINMLALLRIINQKKKELFPDFHLPKISNHLPKK